MQISSTPFVIVDTETTGTSSKTDRIIEIAAVKVLGGHVIEEFDQLINPGRMIPARITRLTSITNGMVYGKPSASEVFPAFLEFMGDSVMVAHNLSFDMAFINAELTRIGQPQVDNTSLCTLRLARRLLQGLRSKGLTALAAFYGIEVEGRHRALGDARATAHILLRLLDQLRTEKDMEQTDEIIRFQFTSYAPKKGTRKRLVQLRDNCIPSIPSAPGIYRFKSKNGKVIYVGKAKNLKSRVRSYFTSIEAHQKHTRKMIEHVAAIEWTKTDSELEALIEESKQIKSIKPRFNRTQKHYRNRPFIRIARDSSFPGVTLSPFLFDDGALYFGPMGSKREGKLIIDLINRFFLLRKCSESTFRSHKRCLYYDMSLCDAPCTNDIEPEAYAREVDRVKQFLLGHEGAYILERLQQEMVEASRLMDYEQAALYRDVHEMVSRLLARQRCIAVPVLEHNAVVIDRSIDDGLCRFLIIQYGRLVETLVCQLPVPEAFRGHVGGRIQHHFVQGEEKPARYFKAEIEEIRLLAHWLYVHHEKTVKVDYNPDLSADTFEEQIWENL